MLATILQIAGAVAVTVGAFVLYPPVGFIVAGAFLILIGMAVSK